MWLYAGTREQAMGLLVYHSQPYKGVPGSTWESHDDQEEQGEVTKPIRPFKGLMRPFKGLIRPFKGLIRPLRALESP